MTAPYQLPSDLRLQPLGVSWGSMGTPTTVTPNPAQNDAAITTVAWQASGMADTEAGQALRAALVTETFYVPSHRAGIWPNGNVRMLASRNPVLRVVNAQCSPASQLNPSSWTQVPVGDMIPEEIPFGIYNSTAPAQATGGSQAILLQGTYANWSLGSKGWRVQAQYLAGFPHAQLTANVTEGSPTIDVDDVTAWAGAAGWISDGASTEVIFCATCTADLAPAYNAGQNYYPGQAVSLSGANYACLIANGPGTAGGAVAPGAAATWQANPEPSGPGTLTLVTPTTFDHESPVLVTTMPPNLRFAVALFAKAQALERGVATLAIPPVSGATQSGGGLSGAIASAKREAAVEILSFRRTV